MTFAGDRTLTMGGVLKRAWWLLLAAFLIRVAVALFLHPPQLAGEQAVWERLGRTLASGGGFVTEEGLATAYHPVGYPAAISGLYLLLGAKPVFIRLFQALLSSFSLLTVGYLAGRAGGSRALWKVLIVGSLFPADLLYVSALAPATLSIALQWALILLLRPWIEAGSERVPAKHAWLRACTAGLLGGAAALVQPALFLLLPLLWDVSLVTHKVSRQTIRLVFVSFALSLLLPAFWVVRNDVVVGQRALTTRGGAAFWIGNHPLASGGAQWFDVPSSHPPFESAAEKMMIRSTLQTMIQHPWLTLRHIPRKWAWSLRCDAGLLARQVEGYSFPSIVKAVHATPVPLRMIVWFFHVTVFIAGWTGWWFGPRGPWRRWTGVVFLLTMGMATLFYGAPAMHATLFPMMLLAAAMTPEHAEEFVRPSTAGIVVWALGFFFSVGVWLVEAIQLISV